MHKNTLLAKAVYPQSLITILSLQNMEQLIKNLDLQCEDDDKGMMMRICFLMSALCIQVMHNINSLA